MAFRTLVGLLSSQMFACRGIELRRTASWGSRDAFTDGHLSHHADISSLQGKRSRTTKAHAFRKFHPAYRPNAAEAEAQAVRLHSSLLHIQIGKDHESLAACTAFHHFEEAPSACGIPAMFINAVLFYINYH